MANGSRAWGRAANDATSGNADRLIETWPDVDLFVSTGREMLATAAERGWGGRLEDAGVTFVTDTCTYITPVIANINGPVMTDSGKWAYYAPGNLGVEVVYGSTEDCVRSAIAGRVVRDETVWADA